MAGVTTSLLIAGGIVGGLAQGYGAASSAKKQAKFQQKEADRQREYEYQRVQNKRNSPGAAMAPWLFDSMLGVFKGSMAGGKIDFNLNDARMALGLVNDKGEKGALYGGYDAYSSWKTGRNRARNSGKNYYATEVYNPGRM